MTSRTSRRNDAAATDFAGGLAMSEAHYPYAAALVQTYVTGWRPSSRGEDLMRGTDLIIDNGVAVRVRSYANLLRYPTSFTLRTRPADEVTKLDARWYVYGWAAPGWRHYPQPVLVAWAIMDAQVIRRMVTDGSLAPVWEHDNGDGSAFRAYPFDNRFVLGAKDYHAPPPSPSDGGHDPHLTWTCYLCKRPLPNAETATLRAGPRTYLVHRVPCYSLEAPA